MILEAFLICALSLPASNFTRPSIVSYHTMTSEEERLVGFIRKYSPGAEVFIHPNPQEDKMKEYGWERVPFTINGKKVFIKRKPNIQKMIEVSA